MIKYDNNTVNKIYKGDDIVNKIDDYISGIPVTSVTWESVEELAQTHTVVQVATNKYTLEPTISGITFFRLNMNSYGQSYYCDLYRENLGQTKYFGIQSDRNGTLYKAIDGYRTIRSAADSSSCTWAYWIDQNTIEVNVVEAVQDTVSLGNYTNGFSMSFISFPQTNTGTTSESKTVFQYFANGSTPPTPIDYSTEYLSIVAETDNVAVTLYGGVSSNRFQYSLDSGTTWNSLQIGQTSPSINKGEKIMFKASGLSIGNETGIGTIRPSASAVVEGNIMSLLYGDNFSGQTVIPSNYNLRKLFSGATNITSAENLVLPATTVKQQCYSQMFDRCTNLVKTPKTVGSSAMTWSGNYCFSNLFSHCTSLTTVPSGLLPALNLGVQCYWYMFEGCTSLATAPLLAAPTINTQSYSGMFNGCTSLNSITCLATAGITTNNCNSWVTSVPSGGTFVKAASASWSTGSNAVPTGWTIINYTE